jgi:hypothetical protein
MDDIVIRSLHKWPDLPAVYGWLRLDRRGNWRIRTSVTKNSANFEPIGNVAFRAFIGRNYASDRRGCWFFQNGPQRVFIALDCTPLVFRFSGDSLIDHLGHESGSVDGAWLDEEGSLIIKTERGVGVMDDRDLFSIAQDLAQGFLIVERARVQLGVLSSSDLEVRFGFVRDPKP